MKLSLKEGYSSHSSNYPCHSSIVDGARTAVNSNTEGNRSVGGTIYQQILDLADQDYDSNMIIDAVLGCPDFTLETALGHEPSAIDEKDDMGRNALHWAVFRNDMKSVQTLLSHGSDLTVTDSYGWTALHWAASNDNAQMVQRLVEAGSHLEARDQFGRTPLLLAAGGACPTSLNRLLSLGANVLAVDDVSNTAFHTIAISGSNYDASAMLETCAVLQEAGLDINPRNQFGQTPLMIAVWFNHVNLAKALGRMDADFQAIDLEQWTVLHFAANDAQYEMIQALRDMRIASLDPDLQDCCGNTTERLFHCAVSTPEEELYYPFRKPTDDEIDVFGLLISEIRERYRASRTRRFLIHYRDWIRPTVAERKRYRRTNRRKNEHRRRGCHWKVLTRNMKRKPFHTSTEHEVFDG